ncbi:hypothetical protein [Clostridium botulinum]|uniref:Lipoprotein n=1 Tax=Clostridium botulinum TaxID=1491 RepID=A0A9Q1ZAS7_CLOBO|nr:hypothetical protein [Clostridium botulinum]KEH97498.1 hypothetical protein Z953_02350 [Clostridium botulinum D str. 16868]KEI04795.1 hypothetical protein Y848_12860 [Clostridium botulinum C/D str. Sp77]KLU75968.1 hypothetical protein CBC3_05740 [Clostridium botulinum V891]KOA75455.1 hypothetical protein ADU78_08040 [Clostridium botulinum]KOA79854.1 hypothetical protein ADU77_03030 [Clostridium botulinum]
MKKMIGIMTICLLLMTGCSSSGSESVKITPSNLIENNLEKLKPHLSDMITGCVKVEYSGKKKEIGCKYEVWENGKLTKGENIISASINDKFNGEVSVSLRDALNDNMQKSKNMIMTVAVTNGKTVSSGMKSIETFDREHSYIINNINNEIKVKDGKEVSILGVTANGQGKLESSDEIEENAKKAKWGLVVKIYFKDGLN